MVRTIVGEKARLHQCEAVRQKLCEPLLGKKAKLCVCQQNCVTALDDETFFPY